MTDAIVSSTKQWLEEVVIGHNFCPFAKKELIQDRIRFSVFEYQSSEDESKGQKFPSVRKVRLKSKSEEFIEQALTFLMREVALLDEHEGIETTLVIFDQYFDQFDDFLDLVDVANHFIEQSEYLGVYQLATFHPNYLFEGEPLNDASHYTNRSPYPMLHLLREASLERVLEQYPSPEDIPMENIEKARSLGSAYFKQKLTSLKT